MESSGKVTSKYDSVLKLPWH